MTNSEAVEYFYNRMSNGSIKNDYQQEVFEQAITALEENNKLKSERSVKKWDFVIDAYGDLKEFICECGYGTTSASNYCPKCGSKMDNSDYKIRLEKALKGVNQ